MYKKHLFHEIMTSHLGDRDIFDTVQCTLYIIHYTLYSVQCTMDNVNNNKIKDNTHRNLIGTRYEVQCVKYCTSF